MGESGFRTAGIRNSAIFPNLMRDPEIGDFKKGPRATRYVNRKIGDNQISRKTEPEISAENQIRIIIPGMINNTRYGILATLR
jgi:hypothetical protein